MRPLLKVIIPYLLIGLGIGAVWFIATECLVSQFPDVQESHPTVSPATQLMETPSPAGRTPHDRDGDDSGAFFLIHREAIAPLQA